MKTIIPPNYKENRDNNPEVNLANIEYTDFAHSPMPITIQTETEVDISRGDLIVKVDDRQPRFSNSFEAFLVWMDEEPLKNTEYILKIYTKETLATVSRILFKKDVNTWEKVEAKTLQLNDIARVQIDLAEKIAFDLYEENKTTGAFILIDRITNFTSAAGIIVGESTKRPKRRVYTEAEKALNRFIRQYYPEWGCKSIEELEEIWKKEENE